MKVIELFYYGGFDKLKSCTYSYSLVKSNIHAINKALVDFRNQYPYFDIVTVSVISD